MNNLKAYHYQNNIVNSHDVINYLMVLYNNTTAKKLQDFNCGIYRSAKIGNSVIPTNIPSEVNSFLNIWKNSSGSYSTFDSKHELLGLNCYTHITSPIRRLVDLLNMICLNSIITLSDNGNQSPSSLNFYDVWIAKLDYINKSMRAIRKVQCDCNLMHLCSKNEHIINNVHKGYLFDKIIREDMLFQYMVYIPEYKILSRITCREDKPNYGCEDFKLYLFEDEHNLKRKIRLQLV